jgi:hypothetical protein
MAKTTEAEFAEVIISILSDWPNGEASYAELIAEIPSHMTLTDDDQDPSLTRPGEPTWHQVVRNITSHQHSAGNAINDGRLIPVRGGLRLPREVDA